MQRPDGLAAPPSETRTKHPEQVGIGLSACPIMQIYILPSDGKAYYALKYE